MPLPFCEALGPHFYTTLSNGSAKVRRRKHQEADEKGIIVYGRRYKRSAVNKR